LGLGHAAGAVKDAEVSVTLADRSGDWDQSMGKRTTHADALLQAGSRDDAAARFAEAEAMQAEQLPQHPMLTSVQGFRYCDLLLSPAERAAWRRMVASSLRAAGEAIQSRPSPPGSLPAAPAARGRNDGEETLDALIDSCRAVSERSATTIKIAVQNNWLLDIGLDHLTLGRAALYAEVLSNAAPNEACRQSFRNAADGLRRAGTQDHLPRGLLSRAWLRRLDGDHAGAKEDLDEAFEIAERGPMPLFLADIHLHRARLFGAGAYPWTSAKTDLAEAHRLIKKHGYLRRQEELEDAEALLPAMPG